MKQHLSERVLACLMAVALAHAILARADVGGAILGTVTDPSGAAVPGARVTLRNPDTGLVRNTTTDSTGSYEFLAVQVGEHYVVEVEASGFRKASQIGIKLLVNQRYRADFSLVLGATTQSVEVSANPAQVEATSTQLGDVIEDRKMTALPLNGRSYTDLMGLQAGVVPSQFNTGFIRYSDRPVSGTLFAGNVSVNGQRESSNSFLVNGGDVEESRNNGTSIIPVIDSIQEFRLITNSFDPEYGRFSGAVVNVVTKSGTNSLHGSVFEFLRNEKLDARNFFDRDLVDPVTGQSIPGSARGVLKRNQFGGTAGGPIFKNRLFFFGDYQGTREVQGVTSGTINVPSDRERNGDFSDVDATGYAPLTGVVRGDTTPGNHTMDEVLTQRLGYTVTPHEPYWTEGCNTLADAQAGKCVFPGQVIPQSAWSPVAAPVGKLIPSAVATAQGTPFFSTSSFKRNLRDDKFGARIDLNTQRQGTWGFYYHFDDSNLLDPYAGGNLPGFSAVTVNRAQQANLSNTRIFGATAVNEARLNFTRSALNLNKPQEGLGKFSSFGFVEGGLGLIPVSTAYEGLPVLSLQSLGVALGVPDSVTGQFNNAWHLADSFSKIKGRHTMKFGGEFRYYQVNARNFSSGNGLFQFDGSETGNDFADFLLGAPSYFEQSSLQLLDSRTLYFGIFAQDTFKIRPNVTLNYGLRWELSQPFYDTTGKIQAFVPGQQSRIFPDAPLGWLFPGDTGIPKTLAPTRRNQFAPRVGLAYSPGSAGGILGRIFGGPGKTSLRAAYGIYYTAVEDYTLFGEIGDAPFGLFYVSPTKVYLEEPYKDRISGNDPGQRFPFTVPQPGATGIWPQYLPIAVSPAYKLDNRQPYAEHYNINIQRQIGNAAVLTLGYVGGQAHGLLANLPFNPGSPARCLEINAILAVSNPTATPCGPGLEDQIYDLGNGQFAYGTRPYSVTSGRYLAQGILDFADNAYTSTLANSSYNALQLSLEKRLGALRFLGAYTRGKSLDNSSGYRDYLNPYNQGANRALSTFDVAHNFVVSYTYDLPLQRLTGAGAGVLFKLLDGWEFSGITRFATGVPVTLTNSGDRSLCGCGFGIAVDRPNYTGKPLQFFNPRDSARLFYFSTGPDYFTREDIGVPGTAARRLFHGPGLNNWDFALRKITRVNERISAELRAEFFNLFNHAQFNNPNGNVASSNFGRVTGAKPGRIGQLGLRIVF